MLGGDMAQDFNDSMINAEMEKEHEYYMSHPNSPTKKPIKMADKKPRTLKTIKIKGKDYVTVNERLKYFRETYPTYQLHSTVVHFTSSSVVTVNGKDQKKCGEILIKAQIKADNQTIVAEGLAMEKEDGSFINKTSFVENAETSAWGRALANFGIGIDAQVATADEVVNAINNQS